MVDNAEYALGLIDLQRMIQAAHQIKQQHGRAEDSSGDDAPWITSGTTL